MKKYTLYIHAGRQKTGTTELQRFFNDNVSILHDNDILYPRMGLHSTEQLRLSWETNKFIERYTNELTVNHSTERYWEFLSEDSSLQKSDFLVSSEGFYWDFHPKFKNKKINFIASLFPEHQVKVIVYVREQYAFLNSLRNEYIKTGYIDHDICKISKVMYFENAIEAGLCDYTSWIVNMIDVLGKDNLVFKEYDRQKLKNGDIVEDFLSEINIDYTEDETIRHIRDANPKINGDMFESLLTYIGRYFPKIPHRSRNRLCKTLLSTSFKEISGPVSELSGNEMVSFSAENKELANKYFAEEKIFSHQFDDFESLPEDDNLSKAAQLIGGIWQSKEDSEVKLLKENEKLWKLLIGQQSTNIEGQIKEFEELKLRTRIARILYYLQTYSSERVAVFGYNDIGVGTAKTLLDSDIKSFEVKCFIDRLGQSSSISGVSGICVYPIEKLADLDIDTVILATESSAQSMKSALDNIGYKGNIIEFDQYEN